MSSSHIGDLLYERQRKSVLKTSRRLFFRKILVCVVILGILFTFLFGFFRVHGNDMYPALKDGDIVLYYRFSGKYSGRDVVIYTKDSKDYVGRIIGLDNAYIDKEKSGQLIVGSHILPRDDSHGIFYETEAGSNLTYPFTLRDNEYFILADRRTQATDSRIFGPVEKSEIKGKVFTIFRKRGI